MSEGFPKGVQQWEEEDLDRLARIESLRADVLASPNIPHETREVLDRLDVDGMLEKITQSVESRDGEKKTEAKQSDPEIIKKPERPNLVKIGNVSTPVIYNEGNPLHWSLDAKQFRESGQTMVELKFKRSDGLEIVPGGGGRETTRLDTYERFIPLAEYKEIKKEMAAYERAVANLASEDEQERKKAEAFISEFKQKHANSEWVLRALRHLNSLAISDHHEEIKRDPNFVETRHVMDTLEKFTRLVNRQREQKRGILILEGEAGTGKNKIVDHFAHLTNRPVFRFTCSAGKDEQDLKYLLEYDPQKGTYRIKSSVIEALETPGAILELDEINTLKPEIAKSLNSLFDDDRALYTGEDRQVIRAAHEVVIVGLQNPQHYMGVSPLAETIKSRARILEVTYPPFIDENRSAGMTRYRSDEASILRQYVPDFRSIKPELFQQIWDSVVNHDREPFRIPTGIKDQVLQIKEIIRIANKVRDAYKNYHQGTGNQDDPVEFTFSIRETVECAYELAHANPTAQEAGRGINKAKKAIKEVILPKIPMGEQRIYMETLINTS